MKIEGREIEKKIERKYPYFGIRNHQWNKNGIDNEIVMFVSKSCGIIVSKGLGEPVGHFCECWNEECFEQISYTVTFTSD